MDSFPIFDKREELVNSVSEALKKKQISIAVFELITDTIEPYYAGNATLWALHALSIREEARGSYPSVGAYAVHRRAP